MQGISKVVNPQNSGRGEACQILRKDDRAPQRKRKLLNFILDTCNRFWHHLCRRLWLLMGEDRNGKMPYNWQRIWKGLVWKRSLVCRVTQPEGLCPKKALLWKRADSSRGMVVGFVKFPTIDKAFDKRMFTMFAVAQALWWFIIFIRCDMNMIGV